MIRLFFRNLSETTGRFLQNPLQVFIVVFSFLIIGLVLDGTLFHLWRLNHDSTELTSRIEQLQNKTQELEMKIQNARDPNFIELEAREKFDLANEGDLVFVFSGNP